MDNAANNVIDLKLFKGELHCKRCNLFVEGFSHSFSRGHIIFKKNEQFIFVADDIWYGFPKGTYFDIEHIFEARGWLSINRCPKCHHLYTEGISELKNLKEVKCYEIVSDDFECLNGNWTLSHKAITVKKL